jgi:beta-N-acetylglucosaminidase
MKKEPKRIRVDKTRKDEKKEEIVELDDKVEVTVKAIAKPKVTKRINAYVDTAHSKDIKECITASFKTDKRKTISQLWFWPNQASALL